MVIITGVDFTFISVGLLKDRVINDQNRSLLFNRTQKRLDDCRYATYRIMLKKGLLKMSESSILDRISILDKFVRNTSD